VFCLYGCPKGKKSKVSYHELEDRDSISNKFGTLSLPLLLNQPHVHAGSCPLRTGETSFFRSKTEGT
jgi:hypothetical protein